MDPTKPLDPPVLLIVSAEVTGAIHWWDFTLFTILGSLTTINEEPTIIETC